MTAALLYRPTQRWQIWAAFAGAVLVHVAAVAMAQNPSRELPVVTNEDEGVEILIAPADEAPLQAELTEAPPDAPLPPATDEPMFQTEHATPSPVRKKNVAQSLPLVRPEIGRSHATAADGAVRVLALSAPRPEYPFEARRRRMTGSGIAVLTIDQLTGEVTNVSIWQHRQGSSGSSRSVDCGDGVSSQAQ